MGKTSDIQDVGIEFGDWKLYPLDDRNWELCHRHATPDNHITQRSGTAGTVRWHRLGKYYQYDTFGNALRFAADCELKESHEDAAADIMAALAEYRRILRDFLEGLSETLETAN